MKLISESRKYDYAIFSHEEIAKVEGFYDTLSKSIIDFKVSINVDNPDLFDCIGIRPLEKMVATLELLISRPSWFPHTYVPVYQSEVIFLLVFLEGWDFFKIKNLKEEWGMI